jgi:hypothetical protein
VSWEWIAMPFDAVLLSLAVIAVFLGFAGTLAWADHKTRSPRSLDLPAPALREGGMFTKATLNIVSVCGAVLLFLSWAFQQSLVERVSRDVQAISNAQSVYQTYQSNNALFNGLYETLKGNEDGRERLRELQTYNYELGLKPLEELLDEEQRHGIPPAAPRATSWEEAMPIIQDRLEKIQVRLSEKKKRLEGNKDRLNWIFLALYGFGSVAILIASSLKELRNEPAK